jgi:hypothetical protein
MQAIGSRSDHGGKTAKALKLKVLRSILARADQVIGEALNVRVGSEAAMPVIGGRGSFRPENRRQNIRREARFSGQSRVGLPECVMGQKQTQAPQQRPFSFDYLTRPQRST